MLSECCRAVRTPRACAREADQGLPHASKAVCSTYRPGLDRAPAQPLRHGHSQVREGEQVDPGPLGRRAESGSRKFGLQGGSGEPARGGNAFRGAIVGAAARGGSRWCARTGATSMHSARPPRACSPSSAWWGPPKVNVLDQAGDFAELALHAGGDDEGGRPSVKLHQSESRRYHDAGGG